MLRRAQDGEFDVPSSSTDRQLARGACTTTPSSPPQGSRRGGRQRGQPFENSPEGAFMWDSVRRSGQARILTPRQAHQGRAPAAPKPGQVSGGRFPALRYAAAGGGGLEPDPRRGPLGAADARLVSAGLVAGPDRPGTERARGRFEGRLAPVACAEGTQGASKHLPGRRAAAGRGPGGGRQHHPGARPGDVGADAGARQDAGRHPHRAHPAARAHRQAGEVWDVRSGAHRPLRREAGGRPIAALGGRRVRAQPGSTSTPRRSSPSSSPGSRRASRA